MEFYLPGRQVRYVIHIDTPGENDPLPPGVAGPPVKRRQGTDEHHRERSSDPGLPPPRFVDPVIWLAQPQPGRTLAGAVPRQPGFAFRRLPASRRAGGHQASRADRRLRSLFYPGALNVARLGRGVVFDDTLDISAFW